jgi:hypothetical protein
LVSSSKYSSRNITNFFFIAISLERFDGYREEIGKDFLKCYGDPEDINYDEVGSTASYKVEQDLLMHYQYHFSQLVNLYHVFEQQIRRKLYQVMYFKRTVNDIPKTIDNDHFDQIKSNIKPQSNKVKFDSFYSAGRRFLEGKELDFHILNEHLSDEQKNELFFMLNVLQS